MDNRIFNVNGPLNDSEDGFHCLLATLKLAFRIADTKAVGYKISPKLGFILFKYDSTTSTKFPCPLTAETVAPQVWAWLKSNPGTECVGLDANCDHDGHNGRGWRVFVEDWSCVDGDYGAFLAIKPAFMWYGK